MAYDRRMVQRQSGRRTEMFRCTIAAVMTSGLALATLFWHADGNKIEMDATIIGSSQPPGFAQDATIGASVTNHAFRHVEIGESESRSHFAPSDTHSRPEASATETMAEKSPVTVLAQFGNAGPGGLLPPGGANRPGAGGAGNGNQPGGGGPFGDTGQGAGGVCIATTIQLKSNPTAGLNDRHDKAVLQRPTPERFFCD